MVHQPARDVDDQIAQLDVLGAGLVAVGDGSDTVRLGSANDGPGFVRRERMIHRSHDGSTAGCRLRLRAPGALAEGTPPLARSVGTILIRH